MHFYLSYIVVKDSRRRLGHAGIAITSCNPGEKPIILCRIGFFATSQVKLEDFLVAKEGRKFFHKTYPISERELAIIMQKINADRAELISTEGEALEENKENLEPRGLAYHAVTNNCKTYALSIMHSIGLEDASIENTLVDVPILSGEMKPLIFKQGEQGILEWESRLTVSKRPKIKKFSDNDELRFEQALNAILQLLDVCISKLEEKEKLLLMDVERKNVKDVLGNKNNKKKDYTLYGLRAKIKGLKTNPTLLSQKDIKKVLNRFEYLSRDMLINNDQLNQHHKKSKWLYKLKVFISDSIIKIMSQYSLPDPSLSTQSFTKSLGRYTLFDLHSIRRHCSIDIPPRKEKNQP